MIVKQIENYQVEDDAARTAIGIVCRATDIERQKPVRLTILDPALRQIPQFERRFVRAARKASGLRGKGLSSVLDYGRAGDALYIAHELVEGRPPGGRATRRLPPEVSLLLATRAAKIIELAHSQGQTHGLLTPAALLVSRSNGDVAVDGSSWQATVVDFGLPALAAEEMALVPELAEAALPFTAPERAAQDGASTHADLYSLGAILYYLLTGKPPRQAAAPGEELAAYLKQQPIPVQELRPDLPSEVADLVHKSLAPMPAARFESAEQTVRALGAAAAMVKGNGSRARRTTTEAVPKPDVSPADSRSIAVAVSPRKVELSPGESAEVRVKVRNRGDDTEHVTVKVEDLPRQWAVISQEFVRLAPGTEMALMVTIRPPKHSNATAGDHPFRILVSTSGQEPITTSVVGRLTLQPFSQLRVDAAPLLLENGGSANVTIKNEGNTPQTLTVRGQDPDDALQFSGERGDLTVTPGSTTTVPLRISARRQPAFGAAQTVPFSLVVAGDASLREERSGELHIPPAIPRWLAMVMGALLVVATLAGLIALTPFGEEIAGVAAITPTPTARATATQVQPTTAATDGGPAVAEAPDGNAVSPEEDEVAPAAEGETEWDVAGEAATTAADSGDTPLSAPTGDAAPTLAPAATPDAPEETATAGSGDLIAYQVVDEQGASEVRLMSSDGLQEQTVVENAAGPAWSPDGRRLAVVVPDAAPPEQEAVGDMLYVFTTAGTSLGEVTGGELHISSLAWSPDGTQIAFQGSRLEKDGPGTGGSGGEGQIYAVASDGATQRQLTDGARDGLPVWSPDGSRLLFHRTAPQEAAGALYVVDFASGSEQGLVSGEELGLRIMDGGHDWSPDGSRIVFSARNDEGDAHLYVANADGSDVLQLAETESEAYHVAPQWSPAGDRILYLAADDGQDWGALRWIAPDGSASGQLADAYAVRSAAWSWDGAQIVFSAASGADPLWNLYRMLPGDGEPRLLVEDNVQRVEPVWQPADG